LSLLNNCVPANNSNSKKDTLLGDCSLIDGQFAYPSSGEVIDVKTRTILLHLKDEYNNNVASEKMLEIQFNGNNPVRAGNQFCIGGKIPSAL